jgi:hypothetical protein
MKSSIHIGAALALTSLASAQLQPTFTEAQFRVDLSQQLRPGDAVLELKADRSRGGRVRLELEDRKMTLFRDDGRDMDERAGDGVYTGVVRADLNEERAIARDLQLAAERGVPIPIFEGRELVDRVDSRTLVKRPRPMTIPIITTSASTTVEIDNSLMITDPSVFADLDHSFNPCTGVGNPDGAWSFGHVMTELAGANDPSEFALDWLSSWETGQVVSTGQSTGARVATRNRILDAWDPQGTGVLEMAAAPFHPIAIVLRIDLRSTNGYGSASAGEARIVYSFVDENCEAGDEGFLAIFEYAINKSGCEVRQWGQDWADLSELAVGTSAYNDALAALTTQFTDVTSSPNDNALGQLRTNDFLPGFGSGEHWQLREFHLGVDGFLSQEPVALTPPRTMDGSSEVSDIMNGLDIDGLILEGIEGAASEVPVLNVIGNELFLFFWEGNGTAATDDRHEFSLNTCNGCHGGETETDFVHIRWTVPGVEAELSGFLEGISVPDPAGSGQVRPFDDLERRRQDLQDLIDGSCFGGILHAHEIRSH